MLVPLRGKRINLDIYVSSSFLARPNADFDEIVGRLDEFGFDGVEIGATFQQSDSLLADVSSCINNHPDLGFVAHNFFPPGPASFVANLVADVVAERTDTLDFYKAMIGSLQGRGIEALTIHPGFLKPAFARTTDGKITNEGSGWDSKFSGQPVKVSSQLIESLASIFQRLADLANRMGMRLMIETQGSATSPEVCIFDRPEHFQILFRNTERNVEINFNIAHSALSSKVNDFRYFDFCEIISDRVGFVEISDFCFPYDSHSPLGSINGAIDEYWFDHECPVIFEFRNCGLDAVLKSKEIFENKFLRKIW